MKVRGPKTSQLEVQPRPFAITYTVILQAEKAKLVRSLDKLTIERSDSGLTPSQASIFTWHG
jgi:hypothetical protein